VLRLRHLAIIVFGLVVVLAACSDEGPDGYDDATRDAFMEGCIEDDASEDLIDVCECTYETAVEELPFERFRTVERRLQEGQTEIPDDVSEIILGCIRQVSATRS
jgi:hypothetical protein